MKIPVDIEKIIEISDPIYTFNEIMEQIDLYKYFAEKGSKTGRPRFDSVKLLKIILFAFMENGYASVRNIEKLCKTDVRFIWMLDGLKAPSYSTISNFMNEMLIDSTRLYRRPKIKPVSQLLSQMCVICLASSAHFLFCKKEQKQNALSRIKAYFYKQKQAF